MGQIVVGALLFCYGLLGLNAPTIFVFVCLVAGFVVALRGVAELTAVYIAKQLNNKD